MSIFIAEDEDYESLLLLLLLPFPHRFNSCVSSSPSPHPGRLPTDRSARLDRGHDGHVLLRAHGHGKGHGRDFRVDLSRSRTRTLKGQESEEFGLPRRIGETATAGTVHATAGTVHFV